MNMINISGRHILRFTLTSAKTVLCHENDLLHFVLLAFSFDAFIIYNAFCELLILPINIAYRKKTNALVNYPLSYLPLKSRLISRRCPF